MISHLNKRHEVTVASLAHTEEELREAGDLNRHCHEVIAEVVPSTARWLRAVQALAMRRPSSAAYFWSPRLLQRIRAAASQAPFDLIWVHCAFVAEYVLSLPAAHRVLDYGDLDSGKWLDYSQMRSFPMSMGYALEHRKLRQWERILAGQFDECTVTSSSELEYFDELGVDVPCTLIPNGVNSSFFEFQPNKASDARPLIAFLGRMDYFPNIDAVTRFVSEVFPLVRAEVPNAELRIIGSNPTRAVKDLTCVSGVSVTGFVPDVRPLMREAVVAVAPLRIARGTQNKILECMAMGVPVVSSPQAAKGVQAIPGQHLLVGSNPRSFAEHAVRLLRDPIFRTSMAEDARAQVERVHSWRNCTDTLDGLIARAEAKTPQPATASVGGR